MYPGTKQCNRINRSHLVMVGSNPNDATAVIGRELEREKMACARGNVEVTLSSECLMLHEHLFKKKQSADVTCSGGTSCVMGEVGGKWP